MKKAVEINILGHKFMVRSDSNEDYIAQVAKYVDQKTQEVIQNTHSVASLNVAILTAMNIADEFMKFKNDKDTRIEKMKKKIQDMIEVVDLQL